MAKKKAVKKAAPAPKPAKKPEGGGGDTGFMTSSNEGL